MQDIMPGTTSDPSGCCSSNDSSLGKRSREEDGEPGVTITLTGDEPSLRYLPTVASPATTDPFPQDLTQGSAPAHLLGLASHGAAAAVRCEDGRQRRSPGCTAAAWSRAAAVAAFTSHAAPAAASAIAAAPATPCGGQGPVSDGHVTVPGEVQPMLPPQAQPPSQTPLPPQQQLMFVNGVPCARSRSRTIAPPPPLPATRPAPPRPTDGAHYATNVRMLTALFSYTPTS